ncbi:MAG: recombinase family protein [Roseibium sp.]|nr:recombinase family protein [Roseibium sp.]
MKIGYARVSTDDQSIGLQIQALKRAGCQRVFTDEGISGGTFDRPALKEVFETLTNGDQLVIWKLDRLGRSLSHLIETVGLLEDRQIGLVSISEAIDTSSPGGLLVFHIMGALAQFERALISERTKAGMAAARAVGRTLGRPKKLDPEQIKRIVKALDEDGGTLSALAKELGVSRTTIYRALRDNRPASANAGRT